MTNNTLISCINSIDLFERNKSISELISINFMGVYCYYLYGHTLSKKESFDELKTKYNINILKFNKYWGFFPFFSKIDFIFEINEREVGNIIDILDSIDDYAWFRLAIIPCHVAKRLFYKQQNKIISIDALDKILKNDSEHFVYEINMDGTGLKDFDEFLSIGTNTNKDLENFAYKKCLKA